MSKPDPATRDIFDTGGRGMRHHGLRRANEKAVLTVIGFNSGVSNAEISRLSGLAPQTVSAILVGLERDGLIRRGPALRGRRGQPAIPILLNADGGYAIGVELGWRHLDVVLLNMHAQVLEHRHFAHDFPDAGSVFETIAQAVEELVQPLSAEKRSRLKDLGIAMPGNLADLVPGLGATNEQAQAWRDIDPVGLLAARTGLEVSIFNDGNAGCWAELIALPRPRPANILYLLVSHYIAAGIIADGALWEGPSGNGANLGSMLVSMDEHDPREAHRIASISALDARLAPMAIEGARPQAGAWHLDAPEAVLDAWLAESAVALARVIFNAMTVIEAPLVAIDSVLDGQITTRLVGKVESALRELPLEGSRLPRIKVGENGRLSPAIGAAELPLFRRYF